MSGNLAMGSNNITGLATPTANDHAVNKSYADNILGSQHSGGDFRFQCCNLRKQCCYI
jgi:hypothetical protein